MRLLISLLVPAPSLTRSWIKRLLPMMAIGVTSLFNYLNRSISKMKSIRSLLTYCDRLGKPRNIAELTRKRLRRAANKIKEENPTFPMATSASASSSSTRPTSALGSRTATT